MLCNGKRRKTKKKEREKEKERGNDGHEVTSYSRGYFLNREGPLSALSLTEPYNYVYKRIF